MRNSFPLIRTFFYSLMILLLLSCGGGGGGDGDSGQDSDEDSTPIPNLPAPSEPLSITAVTPEVGMANQVLNVDILGTGFKSGLQAVMFIDSVNQRDIVGSQPEALAGELAIAGNRVYVANRRMGVRIFDVSDATSPTLLGGTTGISADAVALKGDIAYAARLTDLRVINVADPANVQILSTITLPGNGIALRVVGDTLYIACSTGLQIYDISTPASPAFVGAHNIGLTELVVQGTLVYASSPSGLVVIDISNPALPQTAGTYSLSGDIWTIGMSGNIAFLISSFEGMVALDVSQLNAITSVGSDLRLSGFKLKIVGDRAYVAGTSGGISVVDISDPANMETIGRVNTPYSAFGIVVANDHAYVADWHGGLQVVDVANPKLPQTISMTDTLTARGVKVVGDTAYIAANGSVFGPGGLKIVDIQDPYNPQVIGHAISQGTDVEVAGTKAFLAGESSGFVMVDITNSTAPVAGTPVDIGYTSDLEYANGHVFAASSQGLTIFDVQGASPVTVGNVPGFSTDSIALVDDYIYVASADGLRVIDVSNVNMPSVVNTLAGFYGQVAAKGDYLYTLSSDFEVVSIADRENPVEVTHTARGMLDGKLPYKIRVDGDTVFVTEYYGDVFAYDITDPENPVYMYHLQTPGNAIDIQSVDNKLYIADSYGLTILPKPVLATSLTISGNVINATFPAQELAGSYTVRVFDQAIATEAIGVVNIVP